MADAGYGHRSACQAVADALQEVSCRNCHITILSLFEHPLTPAVLRLPERSYDWTVKSSLPLYDITYRVSDTHLACSLVTGVMTVGMFAATRKVLKDLHPDAIVSTFHMFQAPVVAARRYGHDHIPFFSTVTDLADVHQMWFRDAPDILFVPNPLVRQQALDFGLPPEQVVVSGIPVRTEIASERRSKAELRAQLGWQPNLPAALVVGSPRTKGLAESLAAINQAGLPLQLIITAGGNEALYRSMLAIEWRVPVHLYQYVSNMPELMHAADLVISKAGGLITSESLACGLPLIYTGHIPGQESGNLSYVVSQSAGASAETPAGLVDTLALWLEQDGALLEQFKRRARGIGYPNAAYTVAQAAWQAAVEHSLVNWPRRPSLRRLAKRHLLRIK
jgi:1,2-diacylglycerol 3-beta-galactosyltransferase